MPLLLAIIASHGDCATHSLAFLHQQKSGGVSLRNILKATAERHGAVWDRQAQRDGHCRCGNLSSIVWSFSDEAAECDACPALPWVTIFREPWARLRSAFHYCKTIGDQLCFLPNYNPKREACDFGRRWGNYNFAKLSGLRWFQDWWRQQPCTRNLPTSSKHSTETCDCVNSDEHRDGWPHGCPPSAWCRREVIHRCGLEANASFIAATAARLDTFAVVGLLERLNESLQLFGRVAGCGDELLMGLRHDNSFAFRHDNSFASQAGRRPPHFGEIDQKRLDVQFEAQVAACRGELMQGMQLDRMLYAKATKLMQAQVAQWL